jgi:hypothetical protein
MGSECGGGADVCVCVWGGGGVMRGGGKLLEIACAGSVVGRAVS